MEELKDMFQTILKEMSRPCAPFPSNKREGLAYAEELADGIRGWVIIDVAVILLMILLWAVDTISTFF